jgi:glycosyltransferase involved in cell wall biosynthesis
MKVSVIIATYNREKTLRRSVESVQNQTWKDLEIIVVDDGSSDGSLAELRAIASHDPRLIIVPLSKNSGATIARNTGLDIASGDLCMVWDSDDVLYPTAIKKTCHIFTIYPNCVVVSAPCRQLLGTIEVPYAEKPAGFVDIPKIVSKYLPNNEKVRVARRDAFKSVRYEARNLDFMVNCRLAKQGDWYHQNEELGDVYLESDQVSLTTARRRFNPARSMERAEPLANFLQEFKHFFVASDPKRYGALNYGLSVGQMLQGKKIAAITSAFSAARYTTSSKHCVWLGFTLLPGSYYLLKIYIAIRGL